MVLSKAGSQYTYFGTTLHLFLFADKTLDMRDYDNDIVVNVKYSFMEWIYQISES